MSIIITYASNSVNVEGLKTLLAKAGGDKAQNIKVFHSRTKST